MTTDNVRRSVIAARPVVRLDGRDGNYNSGARLDLINGASIRPEAIHWYWPGWLARAKLHLLAGAAGTGKTTIALALAAQITTDSRWPNGDVVDGGDVLIWSGEDGIEDTLLPRFLASGGDATRLHFTGKIQQEGKDRPFDPAVDMARLAEAAKPIPALRLVILDPVSSAIIGDSHKNAETRRSLQPMVDLATTLDCAVLGITHLAKGTAGREPLDRVLGSVAFGALPRVVWATVRPNDADAPRRLVRIKSNLGPDGGGVEYTLSEAPVPDSNIIAQRVQWGPLLSGTARELMAVDQPYHQQAARSEANAFLMEILQNGPMLMKEIEAAAKAHGHAMTTVKRAKADLGVVARKKDFKAGWCWELPSSSIAEETQHRERGSLPPGVDPT